MVSLSLLLYVIVLGAITLRTGRQQDAAGFLIARRSIGRVATVASLASGFRDGAGLAVWVALAYYYGFGALWLTVGLSVGLCLLAMRAKLLRRMAAVEEYVTLSDMVRDRFGPKSALVATVVVSGTALLYAGAQLYVVGRLLMAITGLPLWVGVAASATVVASYLLGGGYAAVIRTDVFQWLILMIIVVLPFAESRNLLEVVNAATFWEPSWVTRIGFAGISALVVITGPDVWQRIFSARSGEVARDGLLITVPVYLFISIGMVLLGLATRQVVPSATEPGQAFFAIFAPGGIPDSLRAALGVFSVAAVMSTMDTQMYVFASSVAKNGWLRKQGSGEGLRRKTRIVIVATAMVMVPLASSIGDIIEFLFGAVTLGTVLLPVIVGCAIAPRERTRAADRSAAAGMILAGLLYVVLFVKGSYSNLLYTLVPAGVATIACLAGALVVDKKVASK